MPTILIFRIGSLGDTIVALPCFHRVALSFANSRRILITDSPESHKVAPVQSVLGNSGLIHDVIYFPPPPRKLEDFLSLRRKILQTKATSLIYVADRTLCRTLRDVCFFYACGVHRVIGAPILRDLRHLRVDVETGHTEREAERLARCLSVLGPIDLNDCRMWDLHLQPNEIEVAAAMLTPLRGCAFIAIGLGGKVRMKDWGNDNWSALLQMMAARYSKIGLAFIGSSDEFERCAALAAQWCGPSLNLCGRLSPRESAAVMRQALFFLGHDCGPMHLAAAVGTRCVAVFGQMNMPKWWHPIGEQHRIIHNMRGILEIAPSQALAAIDEVISERALPWLMKNV